VIDEDGEAIAVTDDEELADVLADEDEVEIQCMKDLKAKSSKVNNACGISVLIVYL
jgi:hypothetical protein